MDITITRLTNPTDKLEYVEITLATTVASHFDENMDVLVNPTNPTMLPGDYDPTLHILYVCKLRSAVPRNTTHAFTSEFHYDIHSTKSIYVVTWDETDSMIKSSRKGTVNVSDKKSDPIEEY